MTKFAERTIERLKQVSPGWAKFLGNKMTHEERWTNDHCVGRKHMNLGDCTTCIVGEAYGFKDGYIEDFGKDACKKCLRFCRSIVSTTNYDSIVRQQGFKSLDRFITHFKRKHKDKLKVAK